jgi:hypothetical protein
MAAAAARWWGCRRVRTGDLRILDASLTTPATRSSRLGRWHEFWHDGSRSPRLRSVLRAVRGAVGAGRAAGDPERQPRNA